MNPEILRVGAVSFAAIPGDTEQNIKGIKHWSEEAMNAGVDLLLFPELSLSGYWTSNELYFEAQERDGPAIKEIVDWLGKKGTDMVISVGLAERFGGCIYNCQLLLDGTGTRGFYRKTHWPNAEQGTWGCGDKFPVHRVKDFNVGIAICYDNNFPETHRIYGLQGTDLILSPYAYGKKYDPAKPETIKSAISDWKDAEKVMLRCAARANFQWVVACVGGGHVKDYIATQGSTKGKEYFFPGVILFIGPDGKIIQESPDDEIAERLMWTDISLLASMTKRSGEYNHFKDRRPSIYGRITELP
nr:nitrilase-related carbon-nitrogen hydrolase [Candidatus Sigynarchaeota archaeon]